VSDVVAVAEEAGFDHLVFIPTSDDAGELDELGRILAEVPAPAAGAKP
jgi:hypothetical protein